MADATAADPRTPWPSGDREPASGAGRGAGCELAARNGVRHKYSSTGSSDSDVQLRTVLSARVQCQKSTVELLPHTNGGVGGLQETLRYRKEK